MSTGTMHVSEHFFLYLGLFGEVDFAENFSFIVQDEIQSYHWVNKQATVHPFVSYYKEGNQLKSFCLRILSDHLEHTTAVFHNFQAYLVKHKGKFTASRKNYILFRWEGKPI